MQRISKTLQAHFALVVTSLIYAATFSVAKEVMPQYVSPIAFVLIRSIGASILFWITDLVFIKDKIDKSDYKRLMLLGVFGVAINQSLFLKGLSLTTPINAAIIMVSNPVFVLLIASFMLNEKISFNKLGGIALGIVGALMLLLFNKNFSFGSETIVGDTMVMVNAMSWAMYLVLVKPLMLKYNAFTILKWVFTFGCLYVLPFGYTELEHVNVTNFPKHVWYDIAFVVLGSTYLTYVLNTYALRALSPAAVSIYVYFQPFLTTLIAVFYYQNDALDLRKVISGILIISGVFLVSYKPKAIS